MDDSGEHSLNSHSTKSSGLLGNKHQEDRTMTKSLRVGIIGASAQRGWAKESHVIAVQKLAGLELVAAIYAALRDDIAQGTSTTPDFAHAVRLARLVDDVLSSAQTGTRRSAADWLLQS
jgi:predicted dehydrogenase